MRDRIIGILYPPPLLFTLQNIGIGVGVLAAIAFASYYFINKKDENQEKEEEKKEKKEDEDEDDEEGKESNETFNVWKKSKKVSNKKRFAK